MGESYDTPLPPRRAPALPPAGKEEKAVAVAFSEDAIAPGEKSLARLQPRRSQLGFSLLPWLEWGQET
jgi:hypothetical protein